jgi:mono/diheme cytochrome c family protein
MQGASEPNSLPNASPRPWRSLCALAAIVALGIGAAHGENLDQGKSATRLFADGCASCHRSARGLAKGRFRLTLFLFLQQHYATNSSSAWELTAYLESVDGERRGRSRAAAAKPSRPASRNSGLPLRPPMPVPVR